jgi:iron complex outermembrane receptor protein
VVDYYGNVLNADQMATIDDLLAPAGYSISPNKGLFVSYLRTIGATRTRGIEFTADGSVSSDVGVWTWNYALNSVRTDVTRAEGISPLLADLPYVALLNESTIYNLRYRSPRYTQVAGLNWARHGLNLGVNLVHYGPIKRLSNNYKYSIKPKLITSVYGGYDFRNGISLTAGVDNVFDEKPSKLPAQAMSASNQATYQWMYDSGDSINALGGYYFVRLDYRF